MTRTRRTFFIVLGVVLAIMGVSLALQLISSMLLLPIYIACTVFAGGVVLLDFVGILGGDDAGDAGGDGMDGDASGFDGDAVGDAVGDGADGADLAMEASDFDGFDADGADADGAQSGGSIQGTDFAASDTSHGHTAGHIHDIDATGGHRVLRALAYLRMTVYFCLGFGPTGWMALASGRNPLSSLVLAVGVGVVALFLAQAFFRFQRSSTDSSLHASDLLRAEATVTIPLSHETMGRVRIHLGMNVTEQYALAAHADHSFQRGDTVEIVRVTDECVYVV